MAALKEGWKKMVVAKADVASYVPPSSRVSVIEYDNCKTGSSAPVMTSLLWLQQDEITKRFSLKDGSLLRQPVTNLNLPRMAPVSLRCHDGHPDNMLQDYKRTPASESEVKFQLSTVTLEVRTDVELQDTDTTSGESDVEFQVSRDTLGAMLRSMAYIREQLSNAAESPSEIPSKRPRK